MLDGDLLSDHIGQLPLCVVVGDDLSVERESHGPLVGEELVLCAAVADGVSALAGAAVVVNLKETW